MTLVAKVALDATVALLVSQAAGRFQTIGYQRQKKAAETNIDLPLVQCWINSARIDWSRSSRNGPKEHEISIKVQFTIAQPASGDVAVLTNPGSSDPDRAAALSNLISADQETSEALYNAWSAVFEILDDARNLYLGLADHSISDKAYSDFQQDEPPSRGGLVINTATSVLSFRVKEAQLGDIGTAIATIDNTLQGADTDENVDTISQAGTKKTYP
jgi:hypothetical protein